MTTRRVLRPITAGMLAAATLAGCAGAAPSGPPAPRPAEPSRQVLALGDSAERLLAAFLAELDLSAAQKQRLRGVIANAFVLAEPMIDRLKALLGGPEVDPQALRCGLQAILQLDAAQDAQTLDELRGVLSLAQRRVAADALGRLAAKQDDGASRLAGEATRALTDRLALSAAQQAKLEPVVADLLAFWRAERQELLAAMATHMVEGGRPALQQTFERVNRRYPTASLTAFLASLEPAQRQKLLDAIGPVRDQLLAMLPSAPAAP